MMQTLEIIVTGKVQGVYFRQTTLEEALKLGIKGQVKNLKNGDVYIKATATKELLDRFCAYCNKGPKRAIVHSVNITEVPLENFDDFKITKE